MCRRTVLDADGVVLDADSATSDADSDDSQPKKAPDASAAELPPEELKDFERKARREAKARKAPMRREETGVKITITGGGTTSSRCAAVPTSTLICTSTCMYYSIN